MVEVAFQSQNASEVFDKYQGQVQVRLLTLRALIFAVAAKSDGVGKIEETIKWGQASYLTSKSKSGTTIRIDADDKYGRDYALYVNCKTNLVDSWRELYPELKYGGNRSVHFRVDETLPVDIVSHLIAMALTYKVPKG